MRKHFSQIICYTLILIFIALLSGCENTIESIGTASAKDTGNDKYTITEAYQYPVVPGTATWAGFRSRMEKAEACQIPQSILKSMTTKALVETVMNYPLLVDMFVRDTKEEAFDAICDFNGLQELTIRQDALHELKNFANKLTLSEADSQSSKETYQKYVVQSGSIEILLFYFNQTEAVVGEYELSEVVFAAISSSALEDRSGTKYIIKDDAFTITQGESKEAYINISYKCELLDEDLIENCYATESTLKEVFYKYLARYRYSLYDEQCEKIPYYIFLLGKDIYICKYDISGNLILWFDKVRKNDTAA